jgi:hypothetical protein
MHSPRRLQNSRDAWKAKTVRKTIDNCQLRKELARVKAERDQYKAEATAAKKSLAQAQGGKTGLALRCKEDVIHTALRLFLEARIGFRAVARVLKTLAISLGLNKAPCAQTVINWLVRLSLARLQSPPSSLPTSVIWCLDTSIALGSGKILAVLAVDAEHFHQGQTKAITLQDVTCLAVAVADSWTGERIADLLQKLISVVGQPVAYLKDGGTDLAKAVNILGERHLDSPSIDDVSHVVANLFKHEYGDHSLFETFISACGQASKKLKHSILACLVPPKVTTRARFMNLHRLVTWAGRVLQHSPVGRTSAGSIVAKLRRSLGALPECRAFIERFHRDATPLLACQKVLKSKGFNEATQRGCRTILAVLPPEARVHTGFVSWMKRQRRVAKKLGMGKNGLPVSSDPIESLFAVAKHLGAGEMKDANQIARHLPALCGRLTSDEVQRVLAVSVAEQQAAFGSMVSLTKQRRRVLDSPGNLETLVHDGGSGKGVELIMGVKTWEKTTGKSIPERDAGKIVALQRRADGCFAVPQRSQKGRDGRAAL